MKKINNFKRGIFLTFISVFLIINTLENAIIYMSVSPDISWYEASGIQLIYPVTFGILIYISLWIVNLILKAYYQYSTIWCYLPLLLSVITSWPIIFNFMGLLPLPIFNIFLFYYGIFLLLILPIILFLSIKEIKCRP